MLDGLPSLADSLPRRFPVYVGGIHAADLVLDPGAAFLVVSRAWARRLWPPGGVCDGEKIPVGRPVHIRLTDAQVAAAGLTGMGVESFHAWAEDTLGALPLYEWPDRVVPLRRRQAG